MMRTNLQPLAHLVDAAAQKWLAVADATEHNQQSVRDEIAASFRIGDNPELTFHGLRYQFCISRNDDMSARPVAGFSYSGARDCY
ncbi:MAG: hypothetical protein E2O50_00490 [Gammaproteobacteria bacterium]|nr:MAG: hypothetical protein E2O50_00490 [Gammaproteobacteria bacterium]